MSRRFHACPSLFKQIDRGSSPPLPLKTSSPSSLSTRRGRSSSSSSRRSSSSSSSKETFVACREIFGFLLWGVPRGVRLFLWCSSLFLWALRTWLRCRDSRPEPLLLLRGSPPQAPSRRLPRRGATTSPFSKGVSCFFFSCFFDLAFRKCRPKLRSWGTSFTFTRTLLLV